MHGKTAFARLRILLDRSPRARPLVKQITEQLALLLIAGAFRHIPRLPSVEAGGKELGVGKDIVFAVYKLLHEYGITSADRAGTFFTPNAEHMACRYLFSDRIGPLIQYGQMLELGVDEMLAAFLATSLRERSSTKTGHVAET